MSALEVPPGHDGDVDLHHDGQAARAYHLLRGLILDCSLMPGEQVSVLELARRLDVGRTPLREAIRMLQQEGLMDSRMNQRPRVAPFDPESLDALYGMRILSDSLALQLTIERLTGDDVAALGEACEASAAALAMGDMDAFSGPHARFHGLLATYAGDTLKRQLQSASDGAERFRRMYTLSMPDSRITSNAEHAAILDAVRERNAQAAVDRLATHLARTSLQLMLHFAPHYEPRATRQALVLVTRHPAADTPARTAPTASPDRRSTHHD
jgi:DNA-binding GntR family transcriptional regulator